MSEVEFRIEYDGPALKEHVIDVQVLAPSLLAFNDLCREASRMLYGDNGVYVQINVKTTSEGSFAVVLQLIVETVQKIANSPASEVADLLVRGWQFIRQRMRTAEAETRDSEEASGSILDWRRRLEVLFHINLHVQLAQWQFVAPLRVSGITEIRISLNDEPVETLEKEDIESGYYDVRPHVHGGTSFSPIDIQAVVLRLRAVTFEKEEKWQFTYGGTRIEATMRDTAFLARAIAGEESFGANDYFRVHMRVIQTMIDNGEIHNTYEIVRVLAVVPGPNRSL